MPLGREEGLDPHNTVLLLDGDPAPLPRKRGRATWYGGIGMRPDDIVLDGDPAPPIRAQHNLCVFIFCYSTNFYFFYIIILINTTN